MQRRGVACLVALFVSAAAEGATHRVAVVVGNNAGAAERPLRYAESDAGSVARTFAEVGQVGEDDLFLLQGQPLSAVVHAFELARERVAHWHGNPVDRALLVFYFSGHSDGEALELHGERLAFADLRRLLADTKADVRVAIVDSCRSGALLAAKGATRAPSFTIRLSDDLATTGQVMLASSAADEVALESARLGGSIFTHHLVTGLRGAADRSGDGRITLAEIYDYAYRHTVSSTADTAFGAQHPEFDYRLSGQGELVLAEPFVASAGECATLQLPAGLTSAVVRDVRRDQVLAELGPGAGRRLAVEPGEYAVRGDEGHEARIARVDLAAGEQRTVTWDEMMPLHLEGGEAKGDLVAAVAPAPPPLTLAVGGGITTGVADGLGPVGSIAADLAGADGLGFHLTPSFAAGAGAGFGEDAVRVLGGYRFGWRLSAFVLYVGAELGGGYVWQTSAAGGGSSLAGDVALEAGASVRLSRRWALVIAAQLAAEGVERDGGLAVLAEPGVMLGVRVGLGG